MKAVFCLYRIMFVFIKLAPVFLFFFLNFTDVPYLRLRNCASASKLKSQAVNYSVIFVLMLIFRSSHLYVSKWTNHPFIQSRFHLPHYRISMCLLQLILTNDLPSVQRDFPLFLLFAFIVVSSCIRICIILQLTHVLSCIA